MKIGIVDVGGGMRDIYGAGVLDYCMEEGISFDHCEGVSAGSANLTSYLADQKKRNYQFYMEYAFRKEYMGVQNWVRKRNFVDLDYIYGTLSDSDGENPLDFARLCSNPAEFKVVATNALTGEPVYFDKSEMKQDAYDIVKASGCVPIINKAYVIKGIPYYDGGIADPIPFRQCLAADCDKVVVILTKPKDFRRDLDEDRLATRLLKRRFPKAAESLEGRALRYNTQLDDAVRLEQEGSVLILAPDDIGQMKTLSKDRAVMEDLYHKGYQDARQIKKFLGL